MFPAPFGGACVRYRTERQGIWAHDASARPRPILEGSGDRKLVHNGFIKRNGLRVAEWVSHPDSALLLPGLAVGKYTSTNFIHGRPAKPAIFYRGGNCFGQ